jgi:hypothetical protein
VTTNRPAAVLAHGLGGSTDLPIPYAYAVIGAAWALTFTFAVVAFAWRRPRFDPAKPGRPLPRWIARTIDSPVTRRAAAMLALLFTVWVVLAGVLGPQSDRNALPGVFYVVLWVGLVVESLLVGPFWRVVSPMRTVYWLLQRFGPNGFRYPDGWGYRPAALGLFAFVWLELASPNPAALAAVKVWLLCYVVIMLAGALLCGERWFARADPFEVYSMVVSRLSPFRRNPRTRRIVVGNPLDHLPSLPVRPGVVAVVAVLLGSTAFDSFSATPGWRGFVDRLAADVPVVTTQATATLVRTTGLLVFISVVAVTFSIAARMTGGVDRQCRRALPGEMAHSLIPIVVGYIFAHYLSYLVERGQQTVIRLADPFGRGWNLFGLGHAGVHYILSMHPSALATIKVAFVVTGHITAVFAAHDKALRLLPSGHQLTGQLAMMVTMVGYTFTGLYLLFGG